MKNNDVERMAASTKQTVEEFEQTKEAFSRRKSNRRIGFSVLICSVLLIIIAMLYFLSFRADKSLMLAHQSQIEAYTANQKLNTVASDVLEKVQGLDQRAMSLCACKNPTAYLWREGLRPRRGGDLNNNDRDLVALLKERRYLLGTIGPLLSTSDALEAYTCSHMSFVVGMSFPQSSIHDRLNQLRHDDPRYEFAEIAAGKDPSAAILVGYFLNDREVKALQMAIRVNTSDKHSWDFGQFQPKCSSEPLGSW